MFILCINIFEIFDDFNDIILTSYSKIYCKWNYIRTKKQGGVLIHTKVFMSIF